MIILIYWQDKIETQLPTQCFILWFLQGRIFRYGHDGNAHNPRRLVDSLSRSTEIG